MRRSRHSFLRTAVLCGLLVMPGFGARASSDTPADTMSGVWRVTVSPDDAASQAGKQEFNDMLLFEDGQMSAAACASYGFSRATYTMGETGSSFNTTMQTEDESIVWTASVNGSSIQGQVVWTKPDGQIYHYNLSGSKEVVSQQDAGASSD